MIKNTDNKIFISGSRSISKLDVLNEKFINNCIQDDKHILVGDADGVDYLIQKYLNERKYLNVSVFTVNRNPRNNVGNFEVIYCKIPEGTFSKAVFGVKDEEMRKVCDEGYVIWDGESKGSENNIKDLLKKGKKVTIFIAGNNIQWSPEEPFSKKRVTEKISPDVQISLFN